MWSPSQAAGPLDGLRSGAREQLFASAHHHAPEQQHQRLATDYSCLGLLEIGTAPSVMTWNTGETSTLVQTRVAVQGAGALVTVTHFGSVSSGKFAGATTVRVTEFLNTDLDACYTSGGLARLSGPSTLTVLGLL